MKFLCGNCKAKYQIADEKVSGRTLRMKCRRCDHDILIDGHSMPASNPPPSAATGSVRRGSPSVIPAPNRPGSGAHPMPPRPPGLAAPGPRPAPARSLPPSGLSADFRRHVAAPPEVPQRTAPYDLWHAAINDVPVGPMTRDELGRKIESGAVTPDSLCWREGMDDWRPLGELPELAALLRRPRDVRAPRSTSSRPRPPAHGPAGAHPSQSPGPELEDLDEDGSEPTRIADMTGSHAAFGHAAASPPQPARGVPGSTTQPKIQAAPPMPAPVPVAPAPMAAPAVEPAPVVERQAKPSNSGLTTGIAVGLLGGILLVGGPMLYRNTWGSPAPAPIAQTQPALVETKPAAERGARDISVDVADEGTNPPAQPDTSAGKNTAAQRPAGPKVETTKTDSVPTKPNDGLTDEQRKLFERMAGGGTTIPKVEGQREGGGGGGGPTLKAPQLMAVVQSNKSALTRCYESALRAAGGQQDGTIKVTVNVVVGESGMVKSVTTDGAGLGDMNSCLQKSVRRWRFPASGGESEFAFPLVFQPGS